MELVSGYKIPLDLDHFFSKRTFPPCSIQESIASYIHLIVITSFGEYEFDPELGCEIWEVEFEHQQSTRIWVEQLARNVKEMLGKYEKRLTGIECQAKVSQMEFEQKEGQQISRRLKKKLNLVVNARLSSTNEKFRFEDNILLSPFATD